MMGQIDESIEIKAAPEQIWQVLLDFSRYPDWNPQIIQLTGEPKLGASLDEWVEVSPGKRMRFKTTILELDAPHRLVWRGTYGASWLFCGVHQFILEPMEDGRTTRLIQREKFSGLLVPLMNVEESAAGYRRMNEALKQRVENAYASTPA